MSDDDVELNRLRERVYGDTGAPATPGEIARLAELEEMVRARRTPDRVAPPAATAPDPTAEPEDEPDTPAPRHHRGVVVLAALAGAGVLLGAGFAAGVASPAFLAAPPTPPPASPEPYPELVLPQTDDDVISASLIDDSGIDRATTRYIAVMRGFRVFLAQPERGDGVCVVTFSVVNDQPWSAGCTTGSPFDDGAVFGIDQHLSIALGDTSRMSIRGTPVRLSDSVTAYVTE